MQNKKRNTIILLTVLILIIIGIMSYLTYNYSKDVNALNMEEKKWTTDNLNKVVDVNVYNDIPVYGYNGTGIIFGFLDYVTSEVDVKFNKISYYTDSSFNESNISFQVTTDSLKDNELLMYQDYYVILSNTSNSLIDLNNNFKLGILSNIKENTSKYFNKNIELNYYDSLDLLLEALKNGEVNYILLANLTNMDDILENKLNIVYHLNDLKINYILKTNNKTVYNLLRKLYNRYIEEKYSEDYTKNYLSIYYKSTNTSDLLQKNYNAKTYKYGYVINMPYENYTNQKFVGTILNYLELIDKETGVEIETSLYSNIENLKKALTAGEIDFALANFKLDNEEFIKTGPISDLEYVVISKDKYEVNSLKGLKDIKVSVVSDSILYHELVNSGAIPVKYDNTDSLLRSIDDYSVVLMDYNTYMYYHSNKLLDYKIVLRDSVKDGYRFILNKNNEPFNSLFSHFISSINYEQIRYEYNTDVTLDKDYTIIKVFIFIIILLAILGLTLIIINKRSITNAVINKDDKLKYIDSMTSLKNRNYLNLNIYKWDDNVIFPQSIIILDISKLREINDTYGREAGDEVIKKVAGVLINNQLENTDIIRSGGDEFIIYMVGYEEKRVVEYTRKLVKEMKEIPNSLGIEVGYSMILDEVKTVDDAINEAVIMMNNNKEKKRLKELEKEQEGK